MFRLFDRLAPAVAFLRSPRGSAIVLGGLLIAYAMFVWGHAHIAPVGADSSGYFNLARMLRAGKLHETPRVIEGLPMASLPRFTYAPHGFVPDVAAGYMTPTYPPGLPLLLALAATVGGWTWGPHALMVLHAVAGIWLTARLALLSGASRTVSWLVALALALSPLYLAYGVQPMSDLPALVWCTLALLLAARTGVWAAIGCGFACAFAVLIRPTNALLLLPVAIALGRPNRRWLAAIAGGIPGSVACAAFNHAAYGSAFVTGYGAVGEFFSSRWAGISALHYARWLPLLLSPLVVAALAAPWHPTAPRRWITAHFAWVVGLFSFYLFYYFTHREWWFLRFVLPAFPSLLILAGLGVEALTRRVTQPAVRLLAAGAAVAIIALNAHTRWRELDLRGISEAGMRFEELRAVVERSVPANGVVLIAEGSGALYFFRPDGVVRWDAMDEAWPRLREGAARAARPVYAVLFEFEGVTKFRAAAPGAWRRVDRERFATLWRLDNQD